jgi:hypothetical protein
MQKIELTGHIDDNGVLTIHNKIALKEWAAQNPGRNVRIKFEKRGSKRSLPQNAYYHGVVVQMVQQGLRDIGYSLSHDETHFFLKQKFNPVQIPGNGGLMIEVPGTTTQLNKIEFSEYIERIAQWAVEYLNVVIPPANADLTMKF